MTNNKRLASLDALRGFDMLFIMGFSSLVVAICNLFPGGGDCFIARQMEHVNWAGLRHHDTIFPLFLFIAGISFPYSLAKQKAAGVSRSRIYRKVFRRGIALVLLGLIYGGLLKFDIDSLRAYSVLGRIGLAWMVAALLQMNFKPATRAIIAAAILIGYYILCLVGAPDAPGADPMSQDGCLVGYVDRCIFGTERRFLYNGNFDPEGLLSTLPAVVTAMLGMFTGEYVRQGRGSAKRKCLVMIGAAVAMLAIGLVWSISFPLIKKLWTSSFVLVVGAYSLLMFVLFYYVIDVKGWGVRKSSDKDWTLFFRVIGMNSITIYMVQRIVDMKFTTNFLLGGIIRHCGDSVGPIIYYAGYVALGWLLLYFLYKKKIFLKV